MNQPHQQEQQVQEQQIQQPVYNGVSHNREDPMTAPQQTQWIVPNRGTQLETIQQQQLPQQQQQPQQSYIGKIYIYIYV